MKKYLGFQSAGFDFLLDAIDVVEVFDVQASQEEIKKVLVSSDGDAYWRGTLSRMIDLTAMLGGRHGVGDCYVICKPQEHSERYLILKVDKITSLYDFEENQFSDIQLNDESLKNITDKVCLVDDSDVMFMLISDLENLFSQSVMES